MVCVALAGGTGNLGASVLQVLASSDDISEIRLLSRSPNAPEQTSKKIRHFTVDYKDLSSLEKALKGCDALVNTVGTNLDHFQSKEALVDAAVKAGVRIYIPSEFGVDPHVDSEYIRHPIWDGKKAHDARAISLGLKVIPIYTGLFMEHPHGAFQAFHGFFPEEQKWYLPGDGNTPLTVTSKRDISLAIVELIKLAIQDPTKVPSQVRLSGTNHTPREIVDIFNHASNGKTHIELVLLSEDGVKKLMSPDKMKLPSNVPKNFYTSIIFDVATRVFRMSAGGGNLNFSEENNNELVNPGQSKWKWKTLEEYARQVDGLPQEDVYTEL